MCAATMPATSLQECRRHFAVKRVCQFPSKRERERERENLFSNPGAPTRSQARTQTEQQVLCRRRDACLIRSSEKSALIVRWILPVRKKKPSDSASFAPARLAGWELSEAADEENYGSFRIPIKCAHHYHSNFFFLPLQQVSQPALWRPNEGIFKEALVFIGNVHITGDEVY